MYRVMDFEGDKEKGVRSFPKYIGTRKSNILAALFYSVAVILSLLPFFYERFELYYLNYYYLIIVFIADTMLLSASFHLIFEKEPRLKIHRRVTFYAFLSVFWHS